MTLDEIRADHPELGFAVYALEPKGVVTLEITTPDGGLYTFKGRTEAEALIAAFPPPPPPVEAPAPQPEPSVNVFD